MADRPPALAHGEPMGDAPPPQRRARRIRLETADQVRAEAARLYREARAGMLPIGDACRFAFLLTTVLRAIETADVERRIAQLEAASKEP